MAKKQENTKGLRKHHNEKRAPYQYGSKCMDWQMANWKSTYTVDVDGTKVTRIATHSAMRYPNTPDSVARHIVSLKKNGVKDKDIVRGPFPF